MIQTKRTWKKCTDPNVIKIFNEVKEEAMKLFPATFEGCEPELFLDSSTRHLGWCGYSYTKTYHYKSDLNRDFNTNKIRFSRGVIVLSQYAITSQKIRDTIVHEFGHFVSPAQHHNYLWESRANAIGKKWGIKCSRLADDEESKDFRNEIEQAGLYKYAVQCPKCHQVWKYKRMCNTVKYYNKYRCTKCNMNLIKIDLDTIPQNHI